MTAALYVVLYACGAVLLAGCAVRAVQCARTPLHLRWELYPVPHEAPERAVHGGSYFEQSDWWTRPPHFNRLGEMKAMLVEVVFLKGLWEFNRRLWFRSFPFHFGLYLLSLTAALLGFGAVLDVAGAAGSGAVDWVIHALCVAAGALGTTLTIAGAAGLLWRRLADPEVKPYTTPGDLFNLLSFILALGVTAAGYLSHTGAPGMRRIAQGILTFDTTLAIPTTLAAGFVLLALLAAYIPMTQMSHFIGKYFTYHSVRWDDAASRRDAEWQKKAAQCLAYRPTWSAPHIGADGVRTWADIASTNPAHQEKK